MFLSVVECGALKPKPQILLYVGSLGTLKKRTQKGTIIFDNHPCVGCK